MGLVHIFGDSTIMRIIDFLDIYPYWDYSKTEIAKYSKVSKAALYAAWPMLEKNGIVKETRRIGRAVMYKFNRENKIAQMLEKMALETDLQALDEARKEHEAQKHKIPARARG
ncbi:winged helix-turn-helix transcriptional regulator [Candidatus Micrarchaeota archaeon]|nr:winged helix-turn-helix transcriptional regulator [Candidatus Micrarchaeota archaeon]